jgi:hypothetical protein
MSYQEIDRMKLTSRKKDKFTTEEMYSLIFNFGIYKFEFVKQRDKISYRILDVRPSEILRLFKGLSRPDPIQPEIRFKFTQSIKDEALNETLAITCICSGQFTGLLNSPMFRISSLTPKELVSEGYETCGWQAFHFTKKLILTYDGFDYVLEWAVPDAPPSLKKLYGPSTGEDLRILRFTGTV